MSLNHASAQFTTVQSKPPSADISHRRQPWYAAYMAALFESDPKQILDRISYAEKLMLARERELLSQSGDLTEQQALVNALHALRELCSCLKL
jgi:hypothetical protein